MEISEKTAIIIVVVIVVIIIAIIIGVCVHKNHQK